ncbi:probable inactive shikimate kinase like 2, chloroplastic isoform X2 [Herrania umbratica]|uniref:Probable inactive shikimate kinase like 2, chloroplastic isoform X2 n=1 Tax=Herrania umbratica TaxID=108875 RepID=A0A6J1BHW1_9ROSI|nr:probable inactive shikimate kinase like 2, chloroplastic isoform X2 [Herrania umbratica]XP_021297877.1 probable inactive shikimate kinase like 2, chloroplastic isoform X2 [Herrania umbratica]
MAGALASASATLCFSSQNPIKTLHFSTKTHSFYFPKPKVSAFGWNSVRPISPLHGFSYNCFSTISANTTHYEFSDESSEVELRLQLGGQDVPSAKDIFVDVDGTSLTVNVRQAGSFITLIETDSLFEKIKPAETIWYIDDDRLVINLKKQDPELKWPDIVESWESLSAGFMQLLTGTSIYIVGDSTEINQKVARELAVALGYTPLDTKELLETFTKQTVDSWVLAEGSDSVAEAESAILESLSSHVRAVVATLGGSHGAAGRADKWRHLYSGFTVWLSQTEAIDEDSAKEEATRPVQDGGLGYSNADVAVKLQGWDADHAKSVAQASLSALKQLILSDKKLPGIALHV